MGGKKSSSAWEHGFCQQKLCLNYVEFNVQCKSTLLMDITLRVRVVSIRCFVFTFCEIDMGHFISRQQVV